MDIDTSHIDPKLLQKKSELEQQLSEQLILSDLKAIHSIYFDLTMLQEIYIGALLLLSKTEAEYNHILSRLPIYLSRVDTDICKYFDIDHTDEEIRAFVKNPVNAEYLYKASPHTNLWFFFNTLYTTIKENNRVAGNHEYTVYVNLHTTGYTPVVCRVMAHYFKRSDLSLQFKTIHKPFYELPKHIRQAPQLYFMEKVGDIFDTDYESSKDVYEDNCYDNKFVFARKTVTNKQITETLDVAFEKTKDLLNYFTTFDYIDVIIPGVASALLTAQEHTPQRE